MTSDNDAAAARQIWVTLACVFAGQIVGALVGRGLILGLGYESEALQAQGYGILSSGALAALLGSSQACGYLLPGLLAAVILYRGGWARGVHLTPLPQATKLGLGLLAFVGSLYLTGALAALNASVELAGWQAEIEADVTALLTRLISGEGVGGVLLAVGLIAILPALGEEIVFRGLLQPALIVRVRSGHLGIWLTGIAFGAVHMQFAGLLPRVFLGVVLGFLAYYSQRLWLPIVAHALFNGAQVAAVRAGALDAGASEPAVAPDTLTLLLALALAGASLSYLLPLTQPDAPAPGPDDDAPTLPAA